jgi:hypothetical protein
MKIPEDQSEIVRFLFEHKKLLLEWYPNNPYFNKPRLQIADIWSYMVISKDVVIYLYLKILKFLEQKDGTPRRIAFRNASTLGHTDD